MGRRYQPYVLTEEKKQFVEENIGLLYKYLNDHCGPGKEVLISERDELLGLLHEKMCSVVHLYDPSKNDKFYNYAFRAFDHGLYRYCHLRTRFTKQYITVNFSFGKEDDDFDKLEIAPTLEEKIDIPHLNQDLENIMNFSDLTKTEREILNMYFFSKMTMKEIGQEKELTGERIRQIRNSALYKIRCYLVAERLSLKDFLKS